MIKATPLSLLIVAFITISSVSGCAKDKEYYEAKKYITEVFNNSYIISTNNANIITKLEIVNCNINYSMIAGGITESQSCSTKDLDPKRIDSSSGIINIWTVNDERRIKVSSLNTKYWALSLSYNSGLYPEKKVISNLETVITKCK
jgi:hypothetical protein